MDRARTEGAQTEESALDMRGNSLKIIATWVYALNGISSVIDFLGLAFHTSGAHSSFTRRIWRGTGMGTNEVERSSLTR